MRKLLLIPAFAALTLGSAIPAFAGHDDCRYQPRHTNLEHRFHEGIERGQISHQERHYLSGELARLHAAERHFGRDGHINGRERHILNARYEQVSRNIAQARHDRDRRWEDRNYQAYNGDWHR